MSRALRALSSTYVERRAKIAEGAALSGRGKRAAFALFYGPLHFLLIDHVVRSIGRATSPRTIVDLGCGTGAAGAAWAAACDPTPDVIGIDRNAWAILEARDTFAAFGLRGTAKQGDVQKVPLPKRSFAAVAAFTMNELDDRARDELLERLIATASDGVLIVEPLARSVAPWWDRWRRRFEAAGGRADEWRFRTDLPPIVAKLDRATGLDHRELTGRSLWWSG